MNDRVYNAASSLSDDRLTENRGAFFDSILGTLNHIVVCDIIWLKRFAKHPQQYRSLETIGDRPMPASLHEICYDSLQDLTCERQAIDRIIIDWCQECQEEDFAVPLPFTNTKGKDFIKPFSGLILHFFNHQTHHRGQVTTLLSQMEINVGTTDLLYLVPDVGE